MSWFKLSMHRLPHPTADVSFLTQNFYISFLIEWAVFKECGKLALKFIYSKKNHEILRNTHRRFVLCKYVVTVKSTVEIS